MNRWRTDLIAGIGAIAVLALGLVTTRAADIESAYTKLDFDEACVVVVEHEAGVSMLCTGFGEFAVHFAEGDLRHSVQYGHVTDGNRWESFAQFNHVGETIEWRHTGGIPHAAILRWFIENANPETGAPDANHRGQVLVVSTVAVRPGQGSCIAGYVDARANGDANVLARQVADTIAVDFRCDIDLPAFHGNRGPFSGSPTSVAG